MTTLLLRAVFTHLKMNFPQQRFKNLEPATDRVFAYIHWYNTKRLHFSLEYVSPKRYRRAFQNA